MIQNQDGIGIAEVIASTVIAALAVVGLAFSFGIGRGLIDRYQIARNALAQSSGLLDSLTSLNFSPSAPSTVSRPLLLDGIQVGELTYAVEWVDDPVDGTNTADHDPNDLKRVRVRAEWNLNGTSDVLELERMRVK